MICCVNDDILRNIFIRLPAESLIRWRAVCKRWRAIIDAPPLARAHQHQPINKSIIIIQTDPNSPCYSVDLEALSFSSNGQQTIDATPLDFSRRSVVGACKGLVLTDSFVELVIWNPLTHENLDLHLPPGGKYAVACGLGYDYVTDDYKAVLILSTRETYVYSLKSDSWRTIMNCPRGPQGPGVFVGGALNFLSTGQFYYNDDYTIIALDLGTEKYTLLEMPRKRRDDQFRGYKTVLDVLGGCLILCDSGYKGELDVWVMKDYGDDGSWIVLFSIEQRGSFYCKLMPIGFIMKEEEEDKMRLQVFLEKDYNSFFLFDVKTNSSKRVFIQGHNCPLMYAQQIFPGTKFCLHDNCGVGGARRMTSNTTTSSTNTNSADLVKRFVFSIEEDIANDNRS